MFTSAGEMPERRTGSVTGTVAKETRVFKAHSNSGFETTYTAVASGLFPNYLDIHPQNPYVTCRELECRQTDGKFGYEITCTYSSEALTREEKDRGILDPTDRRAIHRWDKRKTTMAMIRSQNSHAIVNAAGEYFDPPPEKEVCIWIYRTSKNYASVPTWLMNYEDTINDADITLDGGLTVKKGGAKFIIDDLGDEQIENNVTFYTLKFTLEIMAVPDSTRCYDGGSATVPRPALSSSDVWGWDLILLNQGLRQWTDTNYTALKNINVNGQDVTAPVPLDASGMALTAPSPDNATYLVWQQYPTADFSVLPLID